MSDILSQFVQDVKAIYGSNLKSVILYGSKAIGEDTGKYSDHNVMIVLERIIFDDIKALTPIIGQWIKHGNNPPLLFTAEDIKKSKDVFPIEFHDLKESHKVLYGEDLFKELVIEDIHLRHQCEYELRGKILTLRQGYMASGNKTGKIRDLLIHSLSSFLVIFRNVLRLFGKIPPVKKMEAMEMLAGCIAFDSNVFVTIMKIKQGDKEAEKIDPEILMKQYMEQIEKIIQAVDVL